MLVPVALVSRVPMAFVDVVDVIAVLDGRVAAALPVHVVVRLVDEVAVE